MTESNFTEQGVSSREEKIRIAKEMKALYSEYLLGDEVPAKEIDVGIVKMNKLKDDLKKTGIDVYNFLYWHIIIGSTVENAKIDSMPLDTPNGDLEKLMADLASLINK